MSCFLIRQTCSACLMREIRVIKKRLKYLLIMKAGLGYLNHATVEQFAQVLLATNEEMFWQ